MNKKSLLVIFLLALLITPIAVNVTTAMPIAVMNIKYPESIILAINVGILGGGEEIDTPADVA